MPVWSTHAVQRAKERFPGEDLELRYAQSWRVGKLTRKRILKMCPVSAKKWMRGYNGRYLLSHTPTRTVFVVQAGSGKDDETIITVFKYPRPPKQV